MRTEEKGGGADSDGNVVMFVLVGIDGVVDERPAEGAGVERKTYAPVCCACDGGPAQKGSPVEGETF